MVKVGKSERPGLRFRRSTSTTLLLSLALVLLLSLNYTTTRRVVNTSFLDTKRAVVPDIATYRNNVQNIGSERKYFEGTSNPNLLVETLVNRYEEKIVDVLSVASNQRPDYVQTQRNTWARHPLVRNFFNVTEDLDGGDSCLRIPETEVLKVSRWCRKRYLSPDPSSKEFSWVMQRFVQYYARKAWLMTKPNPAGWLCAQKRFPVGFARIALGYVERGESLPDYLLVVDDDTVYNMDIYYKEVVKSRESSDPFVSAGCRITNGKDKESGIVFPFGGFGLTFSKGSIERLLLPLSKYNALRNDKWQNASLAAIQQNLIFEREAFRDGMNLAEMMEKFAMAEPFHNISGWTRGFCFHGHWTLAIFTQLYGLHSEYFMDTLQDSEVTLRSSKRGPKYTNLCRNEYKNCKPTELVCHYQTPIDMARLVSEAAKSRGTGYNVTKMIRAARNNVGFDKPPMIVLKSRFMQLQSNFTALGKARLQLFETFCIPTILGQIDDDFLWLIRTDPNLSEDLLLPLKEMLEPYSNRFFLIASNDNTEGFRQMNVDRMVILSGDSEILMRTVTASRERWLVETRLDADDGLHMGMVRGIREAATSYIQSNNTNLEWRAFCVSRSINWHSGALAPLQEVNPNVTNTLNIPPEGILTYSKKLHKSCITPGLSYVLPPSLPRPPMIGHHVLHETVPVCDESHDISGMKCLKFLDFGFHQAIQARTPTSHGMGGFHKEYKPEKDSKTIWKILESSFNISKNGTKIVINDFRENVVDIAKDNLAGQCTEDHSCSRFTRRYLERIIWTKAKELNTTNG